jgi:hypothetical protein
MLIRPDPVGKQLTRTGAFTFKLVAFGCQRRDGEHSTIVADMSLLGDMRRPLQSKTLVSLDRLPLQLLVVEGLLRTGVQPCKGGHPPLNHPAASYHVTPWFRATLPLRLLSTFVRTSSAPAW